MRHLFLALLFVAVSVNANTQDTDHVTPQEVQVGDIFEIGKPDAPNYKHIDFPRANFIIKRGGIANYKTVVGNKVVVTSVKEKKDGTLQVKLKRKDGSRFFRTHPVVYADLKEALETGELRKI